MTQSTAANNMLYRRALRYELLEDRRLLANVTVDTLADTVDLNDGLTSLREAIFATNLVKGPDSIRLSFELGDGGPVTFNLTLGELRITDDVVISSRSGFHTIDASGSDPTPDQNNGDGSRVFIIDDGNDNSSINVELAGLVVTGGDVRGDGGAILSRENLRLVDTHVIGNSAVTNDIALLSKGGAIAHAIGELRVDQSVIADNVGDFGGGIYVESGSLVIDRSIIATNSSVSGSGLYIAEGNAEITRSWIHGNSAGAFSLGGGIYNAGNMRVEATTISGNSAAFGAGIFNRTDAGEVLRITNSTISGNTAFDRGGGVRNAAGLTIIEHSTITSNQAPPGDGGGVASRGYANTRTEIGHTIISGNTNSDVDFITGDINTFASLGHNLIGTGNAVAKFAAAGDQTAITDAMLGPLASNGGPILPDGKTLLTHTLLPGSPAINAGDLNAKAGVDGVPLHDQRGDEFPRIVNGRIDLGAYEFEEPSDLNLVVDTLTDESDANFSIGDLSLREAIELANQWPSTDTIRFAPTLTANGPATILLKYGELKITDDVTIEGPGAVLLTLDASGNDPTPAEHNGDGSRVFHIDDGSTSLTRVALRGLKVTGGDVREGGGGILSSEATTVTDVILHGNSAIGMQSSIAGGGAVLQHSGSLIVIRSTLSGNSSVNPDGSYSFGVGAAIAGREANISIAESVVIGNNANRLGGGISVYRCELAVTATIISGNSSRLRGGAIFSERSNLTIANSSITQNAVTAQIASQGYGGGIDSLRGDVSLIDTTVSGNSARIGGGLRVIDGNLLLMDSVVEGNTATGSGGGIVASIGNSNIVTSLVSGNSAGQSGGGISFGFGTLLIDRSTIAANTAANGGGIFTGPGLKIFSTTISGNLATAGSGGGISFVVSTGRRAVSEGAAAGIEPFAIQLVSTTVSRNMASDHGGGLFLNAPALVSRFAHCTITLNQSDNDRTGSGFGGGLFVSSGTADIDHTIIASNTDHANVGDDLTGFLTGNIEVGFNVIGSNQGSGLMPTQVGMPDSNGNLIGGGFAGVINPRLGPLANNGGPTLTHALLPNSPALNSGDPAATAGVGEVPVYDQRGGPFSRVFGGRIDIGAFEAQLNPLVGDYSFDRVVDAADYVVWRNTRRSPNDLRADGNGDGVVDDADRLVWRANFGRTAPDTTQALSHELLAIEIAPKPPDLPGGDDGAAPEVWRQFSLAASCRRFVGSRLFEPIVTAGDVYRDDLLLNVIAIQQMTNEQRAEYLSQPRNRQSAIAQDSSNAQAAVLDCVFTALGETL